MSLGENIHNAFTVVFETLKSIEKLITKCRYELDTKEYYMPMERFMRNSSGQTWEGWIYWSFILLFQRRKDGPVMENGWIDAPVYAVEINVDSDTCETPKIIIAQIFFDGMPDWLEGCSQSDHSLLYEAIHAYDWYEEYAESDLITAVKPADGFEEKVSEYFWGFRSLRRIEMELVDVNQDNYKQMIFGTIERLNGEAKGKILNGEAKEK